MNRLRQIAALLGLLLLVSCNASKSNESIRVGQLYLRSEVCVFGSRNDFFRRVDWIREAEVVGEMHNDRIPSWADGFAVACVWWEEDFARTLNKRNDTDVLEQITQTGHAEGWILVGDTPMVYHILEMTIEFEGVVYDWIDAWDPPG